MPTPPPRRRNPAVSIRRVQSERKYLTPWRSTPGQLTWKYKYDYARRTVIIPPMGPQPHMIGTSQGVLARGNPPRSRYPMPPSRSEAYLQPLPLVVPPLIMGPYPPPRVGLPPPLPPRIPMTEEEFLAQERLASFLTGETPPHKPRSLLSYPESHLYESLISRVSDISKDDISIDDPDEESLYQRISIRESVGDLSGTSEVVSSSDAEHDSREQNTMKELSKKSGDDEGSRVISSKAQSDSSKVLVECNQKMCPNHVSERINVKVEEAKKCPLGKWTQNFRTFENIENEESCRESGTIDSENKEKRYTKKMSFKESFTNYAHKNSSKNYLKSIFKKRKKGEKVDKEQSPAHTVVSVVHINNDEQSLPKSSCCKLNERSFSKSSFEKCFIESHGEKSDPFNEPEGVYQDFSVLTSVKNSRIESIRNRGIESKPLSSSFPEDPYRQHTSVIPTTVELSESVSNQNYFYLEKVYGNDKSVQVSFEDIARSQNNYTEISTLDPLRPAHSTPHFAATSCKNCQHLQQGDQKPSSKKRTVRYSQSMKINRQHCLQTPPSDASISCCKESMNERSSSRKPTNPLMPMATDNSERNHSKEIDKSQIMNEISVNSIKKSSNGEESGQNAFLSNLQFYSINSRNPDSFVYVYQSPKSSKSSASSSLDYRDQTYLRRQSQANLQVTPNRRGGSSGLGSSGSDSSFEDDDQDGRTIAGGGLAAAPSPARKKTPFAAPFADPATSCCYSYSLSSLQSAVCDSPLSSLSSLKSSRGRLLFDYSWSWNRLNDLVRRSPSASLADRRMTSSLTGLSSIRVPSSFLELSFPLDHYTKKALVI